MKKLFFLIFFGFVALINAQSTFPVNGIQDDRNTLYAFTNVTVYKDYQTKISNATLLVKDGKVVSVSTSNSIPKEAVQIDLTGRTIYPSFIELSSNYGIALKEKKEDYSGERPVSLSRKKGAYHWNQAIRPEIDASEYFEADKKSAKDLRNAGFGSVLTHVRNGVSRGSGTYVLLGEDKENELILSNRTSNHFSFDKGTSIQDYPSSRMGCIALLRQSYLDAMWLAEQQDTKELNLSYEAWIRNLALPAFFEVKDKLDLLRADKIGDEFGVQYLIRTKGDEYQNVDAIVATNAKLIVPLNFPKPIKMENPMESDRISLKKLKHWELAPSNPSILKSKGIQFSLSSDGMKDKGMFLKNLRKAVERGLAKEEALKALTYVPASFINMNNEIGALKKGMIANFIITDGDLFEEKTVIMENWVKGKRYMIKSEMPYEVGTKWKMQVNDKSYDLLIGTSLSKPDVKLIAVKESKSDTIKVKVTMRSTGMFSLAYSLDSIDFILNELSGGKSDQNMYGTGYGSNGSIHTWRASKTGLWNPKDENKAVKKEEDNRLGEITFPFRSYGYTNETKPRSEELVFRNATVWTNESEGILKNTDVYIKDGKIKAIGSKLSYPGVKEIDATGMHLTCGIVDEHSHIAASKGVNEGTQASSAEVRIGDVINSEDINIYRQLSGGVTTAQILHGSANPVGGQSGLIKLRWGQTPEKMLISDAVGFIKFALGENVKQSNWGDEYRNRFPQTRMGVEQLYYDLFTRAKRYEAEWGTYNGLKKKDKQKTTAPRRDLEMDALVEILNKKRFVSCHSYQQGEINMLMHVADSMGFVLNTFTHILEGYKVADKMKKHGAGGSTFSDWWAYKFEVNDAIPYNAAIMHRMGIVTALNSDDAEMGRRLNQEAAKAIKYGGVSEEEAWKMVTLNPAKLLHLDERMGSVKIGKDADLVLWTDNPLSIYAQVKKTYVDGKCLYDHERSLKTSEELVKERQRLINKMKAAIAAGEKPEMPKEKKQRLYHCDSMGE